MNTLASSKINAKPLRHVVQCAGTPRSSAAYKRNNERLIAIFTPIALLLFWEALGQLKAIDVRFFPPPSAIAGTFYELAVHTEWKKSLPYQVLTSLSRACIGFVLGALPGLALGVVMGLVPMVRAAVQPIVGAIFPIPKVAILPLIMLIFGIGEGSKWAIIAIGVFFQVLIATSTGVANIDRIYLDVGRNFRASRAAVCFTIALPGALPTIFAGLRLGWGIALLLLVTAEMVSSDSGIGYLIWRAWQTLAIEDMYVGLVTIAALGTLSFWLFDAAERRMLPWKQRS
ncbi:putative aliphatic sulfonates transport permease protein SsuC [Variovorax boronicumulans]|uniref:ABC transporter permease n=1 Tax=Variovorax boronicumulans TaxID=436515 RepID=UPI00209C2C00|nr:ABC transporter permease [Variovorax boronicumulans]PBI95851.1 putative aliphatic sulfonates transport permease protein SsuC [Variovorax boronicumulans]